MDNVAIALHQLNRAIDLYVNDQDFVSTITLSNAAQSCFVKRWAIENQARACEDVIFNSSHSHASHSQTYNHKMDIYVSITAEESHDEWEAKAVQSLMYCCDSVMKLHLPRSKQVSDFVRSKSKILVY